MQHLRKSPLINMVVSLGYAVFLGRMIKLATASPTEQPLYSPSLGVIIRSFALSTFALRLKAPGRCSQSSRSPFACRPINGIASRTQRSHSSFRSHILQVTIPANAFELNHHQPPWMD